MGVTEGSRGRLGPSLLQRVWLTKVVSFFSYFILFSYFPLEEVYSFIFFGGGLLFFCGNRDKEGMSVGRYESQEYKLECGA